MAVQYFLRKAAPREGTLHDKLPAIITKISFVEGRQIQVYFLVDGSPLNERVSPPSFVQRCSSFMGIQPMVVALSLSLFLSSNLSCARLASRIWLCSFVLLPSTGHFLGSGRTSFRFSVHCVPSCLASCARSLRMRAEAAFARARVGTGPDYPYLFCATHACTHIQMPAPAEVRGISYMSYGRGIFALKHTRQLVAFHTT